MKCRWYSEETGMCCNDQSPECADFCKFEDDQGICENAEELNLQEKEGDGRDDAPESGHRH